MEGKLVFLNVTLMISNKFRKGLGSGIQSIITAPGYSH